MSKTLLLPALAAAATLGGCAASGSAPATPGGPAPAYMALGTEPGWTLEITPGRLVYHGDYGETTIAVANPGARPGINGERYVTARLIVDVTHKPCSDGMSDRRYRDTVRVTADGKAVQGCGGAIAPPAALAGTNWTFVSIGGAPIVGERPAGIAFDGTRMSGSAGCNRFGGGYTVQDGVLTAAQMAVTRMACPEPQMAQERAFVALMGAPVRLSFPADGTMILTGAYGRTAVLKRAI